MCWPPRTPSTRRSRRCFESSARGFSPSAARSGPRRFTHNLTLAFATFTCTCPVAIDLSRDQGADCPVSCDRPERLASDLGRGILGGEPVSDQSLAVAARDVSSPMDLAQLGADLFLFMEL